MPTKFSPACSLSPSNWRDSSTGTGEYWTCWGLATGETQSVVAENCLPCVKTGTASSCCGWEGWEVQVEYWRSRGRAPMLFQYCCDGELLEAKACWGLAPGRSQSCCGSEWREVKVRKSTLEDCKLGIGAQTCTSVLLKPVQLLVKC